MAQIRIVVGTVMGTSLEVAKTAQAVLQGFGHEVSLYEKFDPAVCNPDSILLVCTSSTGMGDLPENIVPFFLHLVQDFPRIAGMKYGVIALGDSSYLNFAQAGHTIDEALTDIGGERLGEVLVIDALSGEDPEELAEQWLNQWQQLIK